MERFVQTQKPDIVLPDMPLWQSELLVSRGIDTPEKAEKFLHPSLSDVSDPFLLRSMDTAVSLIKQAKANNDRVIIFGDYDADGVCASTILSEALLSFGIADCGVYLPDRHAEGYGLNENAVREIAEKAEMLITVDCGITGHREVALAKELGMTVIVTDHHQLPEALPDADAVITPLLSPYPFPYLCGAGVAWQISRALLGYVKAEELLDVAAIATVADMVKLQGENRAIVAEGLKKLDATKRPGIRALRHMAGLSGNMTSEQIAYMIAPRLNASGRIQSAEIALELLVTKKPERAEELALELENINRDRRVAENLVKEEAFAELKHYDLCDLRAVVICGDGYESGVVGLAAGKIADQVGYPTVILSRKDDLAVGSARSAGGVDIYRALCQCSDLFLRFGGHPQAAGMTLKFDDVDELRLRLSDAVKEQLNGQPLYPTYEYDAELTLDEVTEETIGRLAMMEPCGFGNKRPTFLLKNAEPVGARAVGNDKNTLKLGLRQNGVYREAIAFGQGKREAKLGGAVDCIFTPDVNVFNGISTIQCKVSAIHVRPEGIPEDKIAEVRAFLQDFTRSEQNINRLSPLLASASALNGALEADGQGTLVFCRTRQTARKVCDMYPVLDMLKERADDPHAYNAVVYGADALSVRAPFRSIFLADGAVHENEAALFKQALPNANIFAFGQTAALKMLIRSLCADDDTLRRVVEAIIRGHAPSYAALCDRLEIDRAVILCAMYIFRQLGLIEFDDKDLMIRQVTPKKVRLSDSSLYRLLRQRKEAP